ncbi:MAG: DUF433 domain-containing protein [Rubrobacteraceae bacterium]|nr:DUF433 domain-containing protein [Rubrobacteraceae bacterium]MBA3617765.1 DUF433 domain-containing protein [Rubrobacteraceae bacterium]MDQ3363319.1 DUF433 domain-containing protein [Actinomycetota bacterium]MDQ3436375.1 DUF433 domain-containing protein [Actinomycetota bacterium]
MDSTKKIVSRDPGVMSGELVFAGTRVEVKTLVDYLKGGHTLDDFLEGFPTVSREQAEAYLETTLETARKNLPATAGQVGPT